jgi:ubiquinone/menaquinone biosynthesis C-methylase UbiE
MPDQPQENNSLGWGKLKEGQLDIENLELIFPDAEVDWRDKLKFFFNPVRFFIYRTVEKYVNNHDISDLRDPIRILELGCGVGSRLVDVKKIINRKGELQGLDQIKLQAEIASKNAKEHGVHVETNSYQPLESLSFSSRFFNLVYLSKELKEVSDTNFLLGELNRVLKPKGKIILYTQQEINEIKPKLIEAGFQLKTICSFLNKDITDLPNWKSSLELIGTFTINKFLKEKSCLIKADKRRDYFG